jgi:hypothetical protein
VLSIKSECLSKLVPLGESHLRRAMSKYVEHYHGGGIQIILVRGTWLIRDPGDTVLLKVSADSTTARSSAASGSPASAIPISCGRRRAMAQPVASRVPRTRRSDRASVAVDGCAVRTRITHWMQVAGSAPQEFRSIAALVDPVGDERAHGDTPSWRMLHRPFGHGDASHDFIVRRLGECPPRVSTGSRTGGRLLGDSYARCYATCDDEITVIQQDIARAGRGDWTHLPGGARAIILRRCLQ